MKNCSANAITSPVTRSLWGRGALACLAALMLAMLVQPAAAHGVVSGVTAQLHVADVRVREGEDAIFLLVLSRPLDFDIRYAYRTQDLTAKAGKDYVAENGLFMIPAGKRSMPLSIKTLRDNVIDNDSFELVLSDPHTRGYGRVGLSGAFVWTDWWRVEGLPLTKTAKARIRNVLGDNARRRAPS